MKKMPYTIIFIVVLVLLVFAGCMHFQKELPGMPTDATEEDAGNLSDVSVPSETQPGALTDAEAQAAVSEFVSEMEAEKDENGVTVYSPADVSKAAEEYSEAVKIAQIAPITVPDTTQAPVAVQPTQGAQPTQTVQPTQPTQNTQPAPAGVSEYDILRSGRFYCTGSMVDSTGSSPLEIAVTDNTVYMLTKFESVDMGMLISNGKTYMIYPEKKAYMKISALMMKMMGMDESEMLSSADLGFSDMESLDKASSVADGALNGQACKVYTFQKSDGSKTVVYINGSRLLGFEAFDTAGNYSTGTYINSITANVPADKMNPPADYKEMGMTSFMALLSDVLS